MIASLLFCAFALSAPAQDAPTVTIQPDWGLVESALFTIRIEGLQPNAVYSIEFVFEDEIVFSSEETSDDRGLITFPAGSTEGDLPGIYTVQVAQDGEALASADFELRAKGAAEGLLGEVTVAPSAGPIGTLHEIRITELEAQRRYTIEISASESQQVAYRRARFSDEGGIIEIEVFAEEGDTPGHQTIAIYDSDGRKIAEGEFFITAPSEREVVVTVTPPMIEAGSSVEISVGGLAAFDGLSAQIKSADGVLIDAVMARASGDGAAILSFTSPDDMEAGSYDLEIFAEGDAVASAILTIAEAGEAELAPAARISITPPSAAVGSEHLIEVSGLQPGADYMLNILDADGAEEYSAARGSDSEGMFSLRISSEPEDSIGIYTVEIRDAGGDVLLGSARFEISADEDAREAIATIEPQSAVIGSNHVILVSDLMPGEQVNFDVSFAGATVYRSSKTADAAGMVRLELVTDAGDPPGDYLITAMRESGNQPTVVLTARTEAAVPAVDASMAAGGAIEGSLVDGRAEIEFEGEEGQYIEIAVRSDGFEPAAALFDRDGNEMAMNSDSRGRVPAVMGPLRLPYSGDYVLEVFPADSLADLGGGDGDFVLNIDPLQVATISDDGTALFSLSAGIPTVYYELTARAGDRLTLAVDSGGSLDSTLQVLSSDGFEVAFDDDSGPGFDAEISNLIFDRDDTYLLAVSTFDELVPGSGAITVSRVAARQLEEGEVIITLSDKAIRDLVIFQAEEGELLVLNLDKLAGDVEDLFVSATVDGMEVMSYSTMGVPDRLPLAFVLPAGGEVLVTLEKFGADDRISLAVSLERR